MRKTSLSISALALLLICACGHDVRDAAQPVSPVTVVIATAPAVAIAPTDPPPTQTPVPTVPPSPLEATLMALIAPYQTISATLPPSVVTLANTYMLQDMATRQANELATATAWAGLPLDMGTPTVPAPRPDGLDLADPSSWQPYVDMTGFSFEILVSAQADSINTDNPNPVRYSSLLVSPSVGGTLPPDQLERIGVGISRSGNDIVSDPNFPNNLTNNQGTANWMIQLQFSDSTQVTMYVHGMRNNAPNPGFLDFWAFASPTLYINVLDERCDASINFFASFGMPGPAADALVKPLDQVVAEHFPVLDHMYRSVQFPPECGVPAPPGPLETPSPP